MKKEGADILLSIFKIIADKQKEEDPTYELHEVITKPLFLKFTKLFKIMLLSLFSSYYTFFSPIIPFPYINSLPTPQFHDIITTPMWDCPYCGEGCNNKEARRQHMQMDCKERPPWEFWCPFCGKEYRTEAQLKVHKSRWCSEKPKK